MIFEKQYPIDTIHLDCFGRAKASSLLLFAQEAAAGHCHELSLDWDTLAKQGLFWAVLRHKVLISRLPVAGDAITLQTWPMPTTRVAFPRSCVAFDQNGQEVFRSVSIWVLMDTKTRNMVLPGKSGIELTGTLRGNELEIPASLHPALYENRDCRQVRFCDLDRNGHMNNTRYLDWIDDLLQSQFHADHPVREITVCYLSEAKEGDLLELNWALSQDACLQVDARRGRTSVPDEKERVFAAQVRF